MKLPLGALVLVGMWLSGLLLWSVERRVFPFTVREVHCASGMAAGNGDLEMVAPYHAFLRDEDGHTIELIGHFECFKVGH